jgi:hypothetical protein
MAIFLIILLKIWNIYQESNIIKSIVKLLGKIKIIMIGKINIWRKLDFLLKNGMVAKKAENGTGNTYVKCGIVRNLKNIFAFFVKKNLKVEIKKKLNQNFVQNFALKNYDGSRVNIILSQIVLSAIKNLLKKNIGNFQERVAVAVVRNIKLEKSIPVYNIETMSQKEYFANGVLVHNCDALVWAFADLFNLYDIEPNIRVF